MRSLFSGFILGALLVLSGADLFAQKASESSRMLVMHGKVGPQSNNQFAAIIDPQKGNYIGSPARIADQQFKISTNIPAPQLYVLMVGDPQQSATLKYYNVFLANEEVELEVKEEMQQVVVSKGETPLEFNELVKHLGAEFDALSALNKMKESAGTYRYNVDSIEKERTALVQRIHDKVPEYLKEHNKTAVAPFLLHLIWPLNFPLSDLETWTNMISSKAMQSDYGLALADMVKVEKMLGYGQEAPLFIQNDPSGQPVKLESFKGKYVLIDFWASWCGPCRMENPNVVRAYEQYKSKNFTVLGVSLDKDKGKWVKAIDDDNLKWTHVSDLGYWNNEVAKLYRVTSIPQNFLLDPEGRIIGKNLRGEELSGFLEKVLSNN